MGPWHVCLFFCCCVRPVLAGAAVLVGSASRRRVGERGEEELVDAQGEGCGARAQVDDEVLDSLVARLQWI
jgi:Arc/MetJ family transcription regulator